jgi:hypothetical protein
MKKNIKFKNLFNFVLKYFIVGKCFQLDLFFIFYSNFQLYFLNEKYVKFLIIPIYIL